MTELLSAWPPSFSISTLARRLWVRLNVTENGPTLCAAAAITLAASATSMWSPTAPLAWACVGFLAGLMAIGVVRGTWPGKMASTGILVLFVTVLLAAPFSLWLGEGRWILAILNAAWLLPFSLLYFVKLDRERVLAWLVFPSLAHAGLVFYQGLWESGRATGFAYSPNPAGGWLVVIAVYCLGTKRYAAAAILIAAIPFTQSRLALLSLAIVLVAMLVRSPRVWLPLALIASVAVASMLVANGIDRYEPDRMTGDLLKRWSIERTPHILPTGVIITGAHNVPLRMAIETGIPSALAWLALTGFALWRLRGPVMWALLALVLLGTADYYIWSGPLVPLWWLLTAVSLRPRPGRASPAQS